jgi:hypothetical protein
VKFDWSGVSESVACPDRNGDYSAVVVGLPTDTFRTDDCHSGLAPSVIVDGFDEHQWFDGTLLNSVERPISESNDFLNVEIYPPVNPSGGDSLAALLVTPMRLVSQHFFLISVGLFRHLNTLIDCNESQVANGAGGFFLSPQGSTTQDARSAICVVSREARFVFYPFFSRVRSASDTPERAIASRYFSIFSFRVLLLLGEQFCDLLRSG